MQRPALLLSEQFNENLRSSANTGGARVVGLQVVGENHRAEMQALLPEDWAGRDFCVRTVSADGLYDSRNSYRAPVPTEDDLVEVPHLNRSTHAGELADFAPDSYGIYILGSACDAVDEDTEAALAVWRSGDPRKKTLALFVNSFDASRMVALPTQGGTQGAQVECREIAANIAVAFDRRCDIGFTLGAGPLTVELLPVKNGRLGRPEFITIALP